MSIYLNKDSKVIVQGITGGEGSKHTALMLKYQVVGGVNAARPHHGVAHQRGQPTRCRCPSTAPSRRRWPRPAPTSRWSSCRSAFTKDACVEAIDAGIGLLVVITEACRSRTPPSMVLPAGPTNAGGTRMIGPNCPGIITPGEALAGITLATISGTGPVGLVSKSGTLTYQMMFELRDGFSTAIGIGGDPIVGTTHIDALEAFEADPDTKAIVMIGEIGGDAEEQAAAYIKDHVTKPVVGYVAGFTAPEGKTMGMHAIVSGSSGTAQAKKEALEAVGVKVGKTPSETAQLMREILQSL